MKMRTVVKSLSLPLLMALAATSLFAGIRMNHNETLAK